MPAGLNDPDGRFVAQRVSVISIYGRTDLIPLSDMPKTWDDLSSPRFKGKLVLTNPSFTSLQLGVVAMMAKLRGWEFFERLNRNDVVVVQGVEAGGHRASFVDQDGVGEVGLLTLIRLVLKRVKLPVVAAGGICDGYSVAAVLVAGAGAASHGHRAHYLSLARNTRADHCAATRG